MLPTSMVKQNLPKNTSEVLGLGQMYYLRSSSPCNAVYLPIFVSLHLPLLLSPQCGLLEETICLLHKLEANIYFALCENCNQMVTKQFLKVKLGEWRALDRTRTRNLRTGRSPGAPSKRAFSAMKKNQVRLSRRLRF